MTKNLQATIDIAAPPERVWAAVADLRRMPDYSPQCRRTIPLGPIGPGSRLLNVNRDGWKIWPSASTIVTFEPNAAIAFRVFPSQAVWSYTLTRTDNGTRLVERRDAPDGIARFSRTAQAVAFDGEERFEADLIAGMNMTLARIKARFEGELPPP